MTHHIWRLGALCCGAAGVAVFVAGAHMATQRNWTAFAVLSVIFGALGGIYAALDHTAVSTRARWSFPLFANQIVALGRNPSVRYALYLRPLRTDAEIRTFDTRNPYLWFLPGFGMPFIEIQDWLLRTAPRGWRFLSEGGIKTNVRPVEILDSGDWFDDIKRVGAFADVVVLVPGSTEGVLREIEHFMDTRIHNLILVAPPRRDNEAYFSAIAEHEHTVLRCVMASRPSGEFILPFRMNGGLQFARYPLTARMWRRVLDARTYGDSDTGRDNTV